MCIRDSRYAWLEWDNASMSVKFLQKPEREEIPENIKEQLIVELYSKGTRKRALDVSEEGGLYQ